MKITKKQLENLRNIYNWGCVIASSDWTNGNGRWTTCKTPPPFCEKRYAFLKLPGIAGKNLRRLLKDRPRIEVVVAITDMRGAKAALRKAGLIEKGE